MGQEVPWVETPLPDSGKQVRCGRGGAFPPSGPGWVGRCRGLVAGGGGGRVRDIRE